MNRRVVSAVMASVIVVGCSSGGGASPDASTPPEASTPVESSPLDSVPVEVEGDPVLDFTDEFGVLSPAGALQLFAASFAPLPGITAAPRSVDEATAVLNSAVEQLPSLTAEQQAVVNDVIGPEGIPLPDALAGGFGQTARLLGPQGAAAAAIIDEAIGRWERELGRPLGLSREWVTVVELPYIKADGTRNFGGLDNAATAIRMLDPVSLAYDECRIRINSDAPFADVKFRGEVAHEVFHCFQYDLGNTNPLPRWVVEGMAGYAGEIFVGGSSTSDSWWRRWIGEPARPIAQRSYDAIGLFALSAATGTNPFGYADELLRSPTLDTVLTRAGRTLQDRWATHFANEPGWGAPFTVTGPASPTTKSQRFPVTLTVDGAQGAFNNFTPSPGAAQVYEFSAPGEVLVVQSNDFGGLRFGDGTAAQFAGDFSASYCLPGSACACPSGPTRRVLTPVASNRVFMGIMVAAPLVVAQSMEAWCADDEGLPPDTVPEASGDGCVVGDWVADNTVMAAAFIRSWATAGGAPSGNEPERLVVSGTFAVTFGADGSMVSNVDAWTIEADILGPPGLNSDAEVPITLKISLSGATTGRWSAGGGTLTLNDTAGSLNAKVTITVAGQTFDATGPQLANLPITSSGTSSYTCAGGAMTLSANVAQAIPLALVRQS